MTDLHEPICETRALRAVMAELEKRPGGAFDLARRLGWTYEDTRCT